MTKNRDTDENRNDILIKNHFSITTWLAGTKYFLTGNNPVDPVNPVKIL